VFTGGSNSCAGICAGSLEALFTAALGLFLAIERLNPTASRFSTNRFELHRFNVMVGDELGEV
jgi:biopolymer transport protein ExbB/TolQ